MTKGYGNQKPNMTLQTSPVFSASMVAAGLCPLHSITLTELPQTKVCLTLEITAICEKKTFLSFSKRMIPDFVPVLCGENAQKKTVLHFQSSDFAWDQEFLLSLTARKNAHLLVKLHLDDCELSADAELELLSHDEWTGLELHPEAIASFVCPDMLCIRTLMKEQKKVLPYATQSEQKEVLRKLVRLLRAQSLICAARDSYAPERRQRLRAHSVFCTPNATAASPMELALLFAACAERIGLAPILVFAANINGVTSLFCGIRTENHTRGVLSESLSNLRSALDSGSYIIFDPAILSSAQSIDVLLASSEANAYLSKASSALLAVVDLAEARSEGVAPLYSDPDEPSSKETELPTMPSARDSLRSLYQSLEDSSAFKLCSGNYKGNDILPLIGLAPDALTGDTVFPIGPMEIGEKPARLAALADDHASFAFRDERRPRLNKAELEQTKLAYADFCRRISSKPYIVSGVYEKVFHERASRMTFGTSNRHTLWAISGFLRLCKRESGETRYLPLGFVRIHMQKASNYSFSCENDEVFVNPLLSSFFAWPEEELYVPNTASLFERLEQSALPESDDEFSELRLIRETALLQASLDELILYRCIETGQMLNNPLPASLLSGKFSPVEAPKETSASLLFPRFSSQAEKDALNHEGNTIYFASFPDETIDFTVNALFRTLSDAKTAFVASEEPDFLSSLKAALEKEGLAEAALSLSDFRSTKELCAHVRARVEALQGLERSAGTAHGSTDWDKVVSRLQGYAKAMNEPDKSFEASILDLVEAFDNAAAKDISALLPVDEKAFEPFNVQTFDALFETAEHLVTSARAALEQVGLAAHMPLSAHPLSGLHPAHFPTEAELSEAYGLIARILPTLSEYRETFLNIAEPIGMDIHDIHSVNGLYTLNELYRQLISAREYDIPTGFADTGLADFADVKVRRAKGRERMENLEYRLRFFTPELFEDVEPLLTGYTGQAQNEGFLRKFWVKKNHKDVLLQYVLPENRVEFSKHPVDELYSLLREYSELKHLLAPEKADTDDERTGALAMLVDSLRKLLVELYPAEAENASLLEGRLKKLFCFIELLNKDPALSRRLTFARARFAQVYAENECMLRRLGTLLGVEFAELSFENGALGYDGLSAYLKRIEENLPALDGWMRYLEAQKAAEPSLSSFAALLYQEGIKSTTDRRMAASLLLPACRRMMKKKGLQDELAAIAHAKEQYDPLRKKNTGVALDTALQAHRLRIKHFCETDTIVSILEADCELPLRAFWEKHQQRLMHIYPLVLARTGFLCTTNDSYPVDRLILADSGSPLDFAAVNTASHLTLISTSGHLSMLAKQVIVAGGMRVYSPYHARPLPKGLLALSTESVCLAPPSASPHFSLITVNGSMRRAGDMANPAEAETCVSRARALAADGAKVALFALTHGQCAYLRHLLCVSAENDAVISDALQNGKIVVRNAFEPCYDVYDHVLLTLGAAADHDGLCRAICTSSLAGLKKAMLASLSTARTEAQLVTSLSPKEAVALATRSTQGEVLLHILQCAEGTATMAASLLTPPTASENALYHLYPDSYPAHGAFACGAEAVCGTNAYLYDLTQAHDLFERLELCAQLKQNGWNAVCICPLDTMPQ